MSKKLPDDVLLRLRIQHTGNSSAVSDTVNSLLSHIDAVTSERNEAQTELANYIAGNYMQLHTPPVLAIERREKGEETVLDTLTPNHLRENVHKVITPSLNDGSDPETAEARNKKVREYEEEQLKRRRTDGSNAVVETATHLNDSHGTVTEETYVEKLSEKQEAGNN